jgi:hypothetical protein
VLFWALLGGALARLYVLGEARSWALVAPVALKITALTLAAWLVHLVLHEGGHLIASRWAGFQLDEVTLGPLAWSAREKRWSWAGLSLGGTIATLPIGALHLRERLRLVAFAGPAVTLLVVAGSFLAWSQRALPVTHPLGIVWVVGLLVIASASTPGRFRESTAVAGNDIDQILGGRRVIAHWTYLAVVQTVLAGGRPKEVTSTIDFAPLLPHAGEPPEPITLVCAIHHLERGAFEQAKAVLVAAKPGAHEALDWIHTDVFHQLGAIAALVDGDPNEAIRCLEVVRQRQSLPWYGDLLEACIAKASGDEAMAGKRLDGWLEQARAASRGRLAFGGNEWILDRLRPGWRTDLGGPDGPHPS